MDKAPRRNCSDSCWGRTGDGDGVDTTLVLLMLVPKEEQEEEVAAAAAAVFTIRVFITIPLLVVVLDVPIGCTAFAVIAVVAVVHEYGGVDDAEEEDGGRIVCHDSTKDMFVIIIITVTQTVQNKSTQP
jgi:hypothetical protein